MGSYSQIKRPTTGPLRDLLRQWPRPLPETCTHTTGPGNRCPNSWIQLAIDHSDQNGMAFSTGNTNCAQYVVSDGGVHNTNNCGATWSLTGGGAGGLNALQIYEVTGQVHPGPPPAQTDLYFGTQDNSLWASSDGGATW